MKREILMLASLGLLAGCATQAPVAVAERGCREDACLAELDALKQKSKAELDACASENASLKQQARLESEACGTELYSRGQKAKANAPAVTAVAARTRSEREILRRAMV